MAKTIKTLAERYVNESFAPWCAYPPFDLDFEVDVVVVVDVAGFWKPLYGAIAAKPPALLV